MVRDLFAESVAAAQVALKKEFDKLHAAKTEADGRAWGSLKPGECAAAYEAWLDSKPYPEPAEERGPGGLHRWRLI